MLKSARTNSINKAVFRFSLLLALISIAPFAITGCSTRTENDEPEPDDTPVPANVETLVKKRGDYLSFSVDEHTNVPIKWTKKGPLTVYFHPVSNDVESYRPKMQLIMHTALASWTKKTNGAVRFQIVKQLPADIEIKYLDFPPDESHSPGCTDHALGVTYGRHNDKRIKSKEIVICLPPNSTDHQVLHVSEHELGHALGLGHSPIETDVMATHMNNSEPTITDEDARTVKRLYKSSTGKHDDDPKFNKKRYIQDWNEFVKEKICIHSHSVHDTCTLRIAINNTGRMFKHQVLAGEDYGETILDALKRINFFPAPDLAPGDWLSLKINASKDHEVTISQIDLMHEQIP